MEFLSPLKQVSFEDMENVIRNHARSTGTSPEAWRFPAGLSSIREPTEPGACPKEPCLARLKHRLGLNSSPYLRQDRLACLRLFSLAVSVATLRPSV